MVKITVLNDNEAAEGYYAEHGLSYLVESDISFLFDTGPSDVIFHNAALLGLNLHDLNTIILSHGHYDHANGLAYFNSQQLICHPGVFSSHFSKRNGTNIGMVLTRAEAEKKFRITTATGPYPLSGNVVFLGEIPRANNFESQTTNYQDISGNDDFIPDDSGVAIRTGKGLVIISGCAHSGICNMVEYATQIMNEKKVYAVFGGFHLKELDLQLNETIKYLRKSEVKHILPCHCTELPALSAFHFNFGIRQIKTGDILNF